MLVDRGSLDPRLNAIELSAITFFLNSILKTIAEQIRAYKKPLFRTARYFKFSTDIVYSEPSKTARSGWSASLWSATLD